MGRNTDSLLLTHLIFFVLPVPPCVVTSGLSFSVFVHVSNPIAWGDAQAYCREHYTDLVSIRNADEAITFAGYDGWIGLRLDQKSEWKWSRGNQSATFFSWDSGQPLGNQGHACVYMSSLKWESKNCNDLYPFLCIDERLILVQEMRTWEDALLYCRELKAWDQTAASTSYQYDLASLPETNNVLLDREAIALNASTNEVWVGLRFLAGEWLWISGEAVNYSYLPQCPVQQQHCGALVPSDQQWTIMDCAEKRNFLCIKL